MIITILFQNCEGEGVQKTHCIILYECKEIYHSVLTIHNSNLQSEKSLKKIQGVIKYRQPYTSSDRVSRWMTRNWLIKKWIGVLLDNGNYWWKRFLFQNQTKELSPCHKFWFSNPYIFWTLGRKPLIFQTYIIWSNRSHSLKCQRSTTLGSKDIGIRKSQFVTKTQFLYWQGTFSNTTIDPDLLFWI